MRMKPCDRLKRRGCVNLCRIETGARRHGIWLAKNRGSGNLCRKKPDTPAHLHDRSGAKWDITFGRHGAVKKNLFYQCTRTEAVNECMCGQKREHGNPCKMNVWYDTTPMWTGVASEIYLIALQNKDTTNVAVAYERPYMGRGSTGNFL